MGNFFSDIAGGFLGQGPGTDTVSGYEGLNTNQRLSADALRHLQYQVLAPEGEGFKWQALPQSDIQARVGRIQGAYQQQFNPFLADLQQRVDADLSRAGLLTSGRSAFLRSKTLADLAVQSALPSAQYQNELEELNRQDTWNKRMQVMGQGFGTTYPNTIEMPRGDSLERAYGRHLGRGAGLAATAAGAAFGGPAGAFLANQAFGGLGGDATASAGPQGYFTPGINPSAPYPSRGFARYQP